jgi:hypothetical protein
VRRFEMLFAVAIRCVWCQPERRMRFEKPPSFHQQGIGQHNEPANGKNTRNVLIERHVYLWEKTETKRMLNHAG